MKLDHPCALGLLAVLAAGCGGARTLTPTFSRSNTLAFASQRAATAEPVEAQAGLDSQEATIIAGAYRQSLAPKGAKVEEEPMLLVAPQKGGGAQAIPLAPSVPK